MSAEDQLQDAANKATKASAQANVWAFGPENTTVPTDSGPVPTIAEFTRANQDRANNSINNLGWVLVGDFTAGCTVTDRNQYVLVVGGPGYRWDGALPKVVPPNSSPTPIETGAWVLVGDATLRGDLADAAGSGLVGFLQSGIGTVERTSEKKLGEFVSVKDFGAVGDGVTDDTAAFNAMSDHLRASIVSEAALTVAMHATIPPGRYSVSSWNLTGVIGRQVTILAAGAVIIANTTGKTVVDGLNSRWVKIYDLVVYGPPEVLARSGLQVGASGTATTGNNTFYNVFVIGYFSVAPYLNFGSETTQTFGCNFENRLVSSTAYSAVFDGANYVFSPQSDYVEITRPANTGVSFTNNAHLGTQFRNVGGGSAIFLLKTEGFSFDQGSYAMTLNDSAFEIYSTTTWRNKGLIANVQFENSQNDNPTPGNIGIRYGFKFTGDGTSSAIDGLKCDTFGAQCEIALFHNAQASNFRISNLELRLATITGGDMVPVMFSAGGGMSVDGSIQTQDASKLNFGVLTRFTGTVHVDNASLISSMPVAGAYTVIDRMASIVSTYGSLTGVSMQGSTIFPRLRAVGTPDNIDLQLEGKGTGHVRFGTRIATADAAVTGYIEIKDSAGTIRKLAVIT